MKVDINGIKAIIHYKSNKFILCCHGLYSNKDSKKYIELAEIALKNGISCIRFDFRGCGESNGKFEDSTLSNRIKDVNEVVKYIKNKYHAKISLFGSSFGGMVAISYSYLNKIKPLVLISTPYKIEGIKNFESSKYNILDMVSKLSHVLIMHGKKDEVVPVTHAEKIYRMLKEPKKFLLFNTDHSFSDEKERKIALEEAVKWIKFYI